MIDIILLISLIIALVANVVIADNRNEEWDRWVILSLMIGPLSLPFQLFIRKKRQAKG
ncbi:MAG: hypothetical protein AAF391_02400 [Bacteroidota bacterium]